MTRLANHNYSYTAWLPNSELSITTVKANKVNHAGRLTYIQSVLASIPVYYMSTVLFSKTFVGKINAVILVG